MIAKRTDIVPVILGGDMSSYPLAREFNEAFGVKCTCVVPEPIRIIELSDIIDVRHVPDMGEGHLRAALDQIASANAGKHVVVMANSDAVVERLERVLPGLPGNVISPIAPRDIMLRASDKIQFAEMCREYGLEAPRSEVVHLGGSDPIPPTRIAFPLIAKTAVSSAEYNKLYAKGFKKIYFLHEQAELDQLWRDLRAEGFTGDFLVQELIEGDDTYVDMMTVYINQKGEPTMFAGAQVLLEDHAPSLFGNPVAMITRPLPELWEKVGHMLSDLGWRGFANFDMKRDPKTGREIFMDFNPRIGANSYYACAGGLNPMEALVDDFVDGGSMVLRTSREAIYSRAPVSMVRKYIADTELLAEYDALARAGEVYNPVRYKGDSLRARAMGLLMEKNYVRKFKRYYPERTDTAF